MSLSPAIWSTSASVTTSATMAASLPGDTSAGAVYWFCSGFEVTAGGATGGSQQTVTVTGVLGGTLNYTFTVPTGVTVPATPLIVEFNPALAQNSPATAIAVNVPAMGAGNTGASVNIHGYKGARQLNA